MSISFSCATVRTGVRTEAKRERFMTLDFQIKVLGLFMSRVVMLCSKKEDFTLPLLSHCLLQPQVLNKYQTVRADFSNKTTA